jgi:DNA-directed RNA polymerase specialized sigma24 family protein
LSVEDAEDVASETLEAIIKGNLLARWSSDRTAKLRTLICAVVRNVLSNRARVETGRERLVHEHASELERYLNVTDLGGDNATGETADAFYSAWVEDIVQQAVEGLLAEYNQTGKGDWFRVLYGRLCDEMPMSEIAAALKLTPAVAEGQFRQAKKRLSERLEDLVGWQVHRYSNAEEADAEFVAEWARLRDYLRDHGGLETSVRRSYGVTNG